MEMQSSPTDLQRRLEFFGISHADYSRFPTILRGIKRFAPKALTGFYAKIRRTPAVLRYFPQPAVMDSARAKQLQHWTALFSGPLGQEYVGTAEQIGLVHARIGLEPTWYIGGYATILSEVLETMINRTPGGLMSGGRTGRAVGSFVKLALLDMDIALSAYFKAEDAKRNAVIDKLGAALSQLATGDFSARLQDLPDEYRRTEEDFESMRRCIAEALQEVSEAASAIQIGANEIRQASDNLASRTEQQAASLEETAASMQQLTSGIRESNEGVARVSAAIADAREQACNGGAVISRAVEAMDTIQASTVQIGKIVELIEGIAFQTNLLALNAGVEAARAGESGRGFAVVANEVRALAARTTESANQIKSVIKDSIDQVATGVALVGDSGSIFGKILSEVTEVAKLASEISELTQSQTTGTLQVNSAVRDMDLMTQQNAAMVEQSTAASHSLARQSQALDGLVQRFNLDSGAGSRANVRPLTRRAA